ncbi:hypothetical protein DKX38_022198 [Salix brachista]|uniref:F-box domain-containing protein n=1 Tax=Salix brachista TaxID=2182728 RepID=A0A5N5JZ37_9ROSI|nr:hypothetical protein DKX38_022198 [Salix brachista]
MEENPNQDPSATTAADATSTTTTNLNDLSQDILLHILSFLPTLESITTSLISKKWKSLWSLVPSLNFSYVHFPIYKSFFTTRQFFSEFVDRTLILKPHLPLQKFRLEFIYEDRYGCHVDSWVRYAIRNRVSELDLDFFIDESFHIVELEGRRDYDFPFSAPRNGFKACPNIEVLKLENCYGMENLRLCSEKLKRLGLSSFYTAERELYLELDCPNLVSLGIDCVETGEFCIKNLSSLIEFRTSTAHKTEHYGHWFKVVKQLHRIAHIKHLVVQNWWRKVWIVLRVTGEMDYLKVEEGLRILFPSLLRNVEISRTGKFFGNQRSRTIQIQDGHLIWYTQYDLLGMAALLELCPNLETMILDPLYKIDDDESLSEELLNKPIHFSIPSLKEVKLKVIPGENQNQIVQFVALLKKQRVVLDKIVLVPLYSGISVSRRRPLREEVNE